MSPIISSPTCTTTHPPVIWLTGLPGSGKTTIAKALSLKLKESGFKVSSSMEILLERSLVQSLDLQSRIGSYILGGLYIYANYYQETESLLLFV